MECVTYDHEAQRALGFLKGVDPSNWVFDGSGTESLLAVRGQAGFTASAHKRLTAPVASDGQPPPLYVLDVASHRAPSPSQGTQTDHAGDTRGPECCTADRVGAGRVRDRCRLQTAGECGACTGQGRSGCAQADRPASGEARTVQKLCHAEQDQGVLGGPCRTRGLQHRRSGPVDTEADMVPSGPLTLALGADAIEALTIGARGLEQQGDPALTSAAGAELARLPEALP